MSRKYRFDSLEPASDPAFAMLRLHAVVLSLVAACTVPPASTGSGVESPPPVAAPEASIWMRAVGDIMFARGIEQQWRGSLGMASLFRPMRSFLRAPDITLGNLETSLATAGDRQWRQVHIRSHPNAVFPLADAGFDIVSLANNHTGDYGVSALAETLRVLGETGIDAVGASRPGEDWPRRVVLRRHGIDIAFLGFSVFRTASLHWVDDDPLGLSVVTAQVTAAKRAADLVVVAFHWGKEYRSDQTERQTALGRAAVDAGADLVVAHHPHQLAGVEVYQGRAIAYSLGNFLFDQPWQHTRESTVADWRAWRDGRQVLRLYPVRISKGPYSPHLLLGDEAREHLESLQQLCADLGTDSRIADGALEILGIGRVAPERVVAETHDSH